MAKTSKNNSKAGNEAQKVLSPKRYFESGRVRKLPLGKMYMAEHRDERGALVHMILITRDHKNGNKAAVNFVFYVSIGLVNYSFYDYNLNPEVIELFVKQYNLKPYEDYFSLRDTIYEAYEMAWQKEYGVSSALPAALMILEEPSTAVPRSASSSLFKKWVARAKKVMQPAHSNKKQGFVDLSDYEKESLLYYEPLEVKGWDRQDWAAYLSQVKNKTLFDCLLDGITPLLYIFEKCILPICEEPESALASAIERFVDSSTKLTRQRLDKIENYSASDQELDEYLMYYTQIKHPDAQTDYKALFADILESSKKHPDNPQFYKLANACYQLLKEEYAEHELSEKIYRQFPEHLFAKVIYINSLTQREEVHKIEEIIDHKFLLEDIYPSRNSFNYSEYKHFYTVLIFYLFESGQYAGGWSLYKAFIRSPHYSSPQLDDIRLRLGICLTRPADMAFNLLGLVNREELAESQLYEGLGV